MKKLPVLFFLLLSTFVFAQDGYEIKVTFKPFKNQYVYLGHYFGKQYPIIDSAKLNNNSEAVFKGSKKLQGGIYLIGYPGKTGFFEILIDKQQRFSLFADTTTLKKGIRFTNSSDNVIFINYQQYMTAKGKEIFALQQQLKTTSTSIDSNRIRNQLTKLDKSIVEYREGIIKKNPTALLSTLLITMKEPVLTGILKEPKTKNDSLTAYNFYKSHFWDGVNFWDGRLAYTTFFEEKLDKYFNQIVSPQPDSIIKEIDWMLGYASANEEINRFLLIKFVNRYLVQKYMWEDMIFVHLFEKYFANKTYSWLSEQGRKTITDRAYSLMANVMGTPASEIELPDMKGISTSLYAQQAPYIIIAFWDPTCGHCKEVLPKLDSLYLSKWEAAGIKLFAVAKETDGTKKDWLDFITAQHLQEWTHVYYSKTDDKARTNANIPGYSQLYDLQTFPTLYLLDKDKRIIAKKLTYGQIDEVLQLKMKGE
ncbi:MAG: thioredoxin-like domain-containing protein [Chitinophagaceae bacterium]